MVDANTDIDLIAMEAARIFDPMILDPHIPAVVRIVEGTVEGLIWELDGWDDKRLAWRLLQPGKETFAKLGEIACVCEVRRTCFYAAGMGLSTREGLTISIPELQRRVDRILAAVAKRKGVDQ